MITIENPEIFGKTIADAIVKIELNSSLKTWERLRWLNAVAKAATQIEDFGNWMDYDAGRETLLIWSDNSNAIYETNGVCQCESFKRGNPCWHRAAKQIVKVYLGAVEREAAAVLSEVEAETEAWHYVNEIFISPEAVGCGCVYNWDDKFTEVYCPKHQEEADEADAAENYYEEHFDIHSHNNAPYLKPSSDAKSTKIGGFRI